MQIRDDSGVAWYMASHEISETGWTLFIAVPQSYARRVEASNASVALDLSGETTLLVSGAIEPLSVGGVLVYG